MKRPGATFMNTAWSYTVPRSRITRNDVLPRCAIRSLYSWNARGTAERWIKEGKAAIKRTRRSATHTNGPCREARKLATMHLKFGVHPENPRGNLLGGG
jgi:hypothetical protein